MNQKNLEYLQNQIKFTGFGEEPGKKLPEQLEKQEPEFSLLHNTKIGNDEVTASLQFRKSKETDMYFFNHYHVSLKPDHAKDSITQTFYINRDSENITLKEAFNLMNGRAVNKELTNKEGEKYSAWVQLNFKETESNGNFKVQLYHQNYGYDVLAALAKHPIKELKDEKEAGRLIESINRGNRQLVTFEVNGAEQRMFVEANPKFKTVNVYDAHMQRIGTKKEKGESQGTGEQKSERQSSKNSLQSEGENADEGPRKQQNKNRRQGLH